MPVLEGAHNFTAHNSSFIDNSVGNNSVVNNSSNGPSGIDILLEASNPDATYDSAARNYTPQCFPGTREQYIEDIVQWAIPAVHDAPLPLLWVNGAAGVGKSAVAQTSAGKIKESGPLGASFFFSINGRDKPITFFPSIAYQLSVEFGDYRNLVNGKVLQDKTLVKKAMASQYQSLIVEPLVELEKQGKGIGKRIVIVVDGLDECEGVEAQCDIIKIIAKSASEGTTALCWAFFSRPESHITATFSQPDVDNLCRRITLPVSSDTDGDIELYLRGSFSNILRSRSITPPWPSDGDLKVIVKAANGLFIYAATVYRFIVQPGWLSLEEPLRAVLDLILEVNKGSRSGSTPRSPFAALDAFYLLILERVPEQILPSVLLLFAIKCIRSDLGAMVLANLLRLSKTGIHALCAHLSAVLQFHEGHDFFEGYSDLESLVDTFPGWVYLGVGPVAVPFITSMMINHLGGLIEFYHKSFADFLSDSARSGRFCVFSIENHAHRVDNLRRLQLDYEESYCFRNSELVLAPGVPDSGFSLSYPYKNEFGNSLIKAFVYHVTCSLYLYNSYESDRAPRAQEVVAINFRKQLQIAALLFPPSRVIPCLMPEHGLLKCIGDTRLTLVRGPLWGEFKEGIEFEQEKGIIQLYPRWRNALSRFWPSRKKSQDKIESGLYIIGHGSKAIFWFWEYNHDKGYYRDFRTTNLKEGKKIFRAERFDLWKPEGYSAGREATSSTGNVGGSNVTEADGRSP